METLFLLMKKTRAKKFKVRMFYHLQNLFWGGGLSRGFFGLGFFVQGVFVGGLCPGGFCPGGFCPDTHQSVRLFEGHRSE